VTKPLRCAIYTRKSSEEGLEQDFNSLHAQREASEAYILSQKHEGWQLIKTEYDDGGYSGGTMNRPGLLRLMQDIEAGKIDVVVVYKVDRLSRSLHDFAKMVEVFDRHKVSFVSVTQQFNTTTSMGRLTLNVLLSFAQFEREVTGERIRDKIAASKKKGMWMGGHPPLGYDRVEKKLVVNLAEAEALRCIFTRYLELGSVRALREDLITRDIYNKARVHDGELCDPVPFSRGGLYQLLTNPVYIGKIRHKDAIYDGEHTAIIDQALWDAVQQQLLVHGPELRRKTRVTDRSLLAGKLSDAGGDPLSPSHTVKQGRRYRYYISRSIARDPRADKNHGWRIPAFEIEQRVIQAVRSTLGDQAKLAVLLETANVEPQHLMRYLHEARTLAKRLDIEVDHFNIIPTLLERVELKQDCMQLTLKLISGTAPAAIITADLPMQIKRRGVEMCMVVGDCRGKPDPNLLKAVARARLWFDELATGKVTSVADIVKREGLDQGYVSRLLKLAFLPPKVVESVVTGTQPADWTVNVLQNKCNWNSEIGD
jgi:site-specific DNA recombinase